MEKLSIGAARRLALAAQGFFDPPPRGLVDRRHLRRVIGRVGLIQIDSVNVLARSHYLPLFSRLGPYPMGLLDDEVYRHRGLFEYWAHVASFVPMEDYPLWRWAMDRHERGEGQGHSSSLLQQDRGYIEAVYEEVADRGPLGVSDLSEPGERAGPWWGWAKGKIALEILFAMGRVAVAERRNFERRYDIAERVIPEAVRQAPAPDAEEAARLLVLKAARSLGVATLGDVSDYYRLKVGRTRQAVRQLVEQHDLVPVAVEGWKDAAYVVPATPVPRKAPDIAALLTPFDSLVWERARTERLFGFRYRIEIYVPAPQRVYGYYVLPFLLGERIAGRVDVKADRATRVLRAPGVWLEEGAPAETGPRMLDELERMARWLGLDAVEAAPPVVR